jgi:hypothetical protein
MRTNPVKNVSVTPHEAPAEVAAAAVTLAEWLCKHPDRGEALNFVEYTMTWPQTGERLSVALVKPGGASPVEMLAAEQARTP